MKKSAAGTLRSPPGPAMRSSASIASRQVPISPAGSACAVDPPMVPRWRTCGSATVAAASASRGACSRIRGSRAAAAWVVIAPITSSSPSSRAPSNPGTFASPTTSSGSAIRSRNTGMKLCPPARIFAPIGAPASSSTASAVDVGASYSKALGIMSLLLRVDRVPDPGGGAGHLDVVDTQVPDRVENSVDDRRSGGDGTGLAHPFDPEFVRRGGGFRPIGDELRQVGGTGEQVVGEGRRQQGPRVVVDRLFEQCLGDPLREPAVHLPVDQERVDHVADVIDAYVLADLHLPRLGVDLHRSEVRAV